MGNFWLLVTFKSGWRMVGVAASGSFWKALYPFLFDRLFVLEYSCTLDRTNTRLI